jgi:hypothetical protein
MSDTPLDVAIPVAASSLPADGTCEVCGLRMVVEQGRNPTLGGRRQ